MRCCDMAENKMDIEDLHKGSEAWWEEVEILGFIGKKIHSKCSFVISKERHFHDWFDEIFTSILVGTCARMQQGYSMT